MHGKALLVIERIESWRGPKVFNFDVNAIIFTCSVPGMGWQAREDIEGLLEFDTWQAPDAAYKLEVGEKIWVKVTYEIDCHKDYWGEVDCNIEYFKQKVIRRRKPSKDRYISKADR